MMPNSLGGYSTRKNLTIERELARHAFKGFDNSPGRKNHHTNQAICGTVVNMQYFDSVGLMGVKKRALIIGFSLICSWSTKK
jgi:hypothetical protein